MIFISRGRVFVVCNGMKWVFKYKCLIIQKIVFFFFFFFFSPFWNLKIGVKSELCRIKQFFSSLARIYFFLCWSSQRVKRMAWFATKIYMSLVQSCLSCWVQLVCTFGGGGSLPYALPHTPLLSLFLIFTLGHELALSCTFTYPKWHNLGFNAIYALGMNTWSIHF